MTRQLKGYAQSCHGGVSVLILWTQITFKYKVKTKNDKFLNANFETNETTNENQQINILAQVVAQAGGLKLRAKSLN